MNFRIFGACKLVNNSPIRVKLKNRILFLSTPQKYVGEIKVFLHSFLTSVLDGRKSYEGTVQQ